MSFLLKDWHCKRTHICPIKKCTAWDAPRGYSIATSLARRGSTGMPGLVNLMAPLYPSGLEGCGWIPCAICITRVAFCRLFYTKMQKVWNVPNVLGWHWKLSLNFIYRQLECTSHLERLTGTATGTTQVLRTHKNQQTLVYCYWVQRWHSKWRKILNSKYSKFCV